ncbi:GDSL-type esterase/lipase family protein [uncultured Bacteroides sp.]|uniref:GDSL-type esterase/lipase family protein n=1 Tax=uncultured Bacteroides sp. TaxID=162156 RepID=UPI002AAB73DA|nr:GDSL-type esterase/lipase family protein [uncultured Bacteroides sp.]
MKKKSYLQFLCLLLFCCNLTFAQQKVIKVACVGNSITQGVGVKDQKKDSYPAVLGRLLGDGYEVHNFGFSGRTLLNKGDHPYMKEKKYQDALDFMPDIVTIKLGTNDSKPQNWKYKKEFKKDLTTMVKAFKALPSKPKIYLCYPVQAYAIQWGINDSIITHDVIPYIKAVAKKMKVETIDLHTPLSGCPQYFPDHVHPNEAGAIRIAEEIYKVLKKQDIPN